MGKQTPSAPRSSGTFACQGAVEATRTKGTIGVPAVAAIMAWQAPASMAPCSMSMMIQSSPERAMTCTVCTDGIVAIAPSVVFPSRQIAFSRLISAGMTCPASPALRCGRDYRTAGALVHRDHGPRRHLPVQPILDPEFVVHGI